MADINFNPSASAHDMQLRTRKENKFDEVEANLPDPKASHLQVSSQFNIGNFINRIGDLNPFGKNVSKGDVVWLFDNTAYKNSHLGHWHAEYVAAVFEGEPKCKVADIVAGVASTIGLADDATERQTIEERIMPFLWDIQVARIVEVEEQGQAQAQALKLGPTSLNGLSSDVLKISTCNKGSFATASAKVPSDVEGVLEMRTFYAGAEGWGIISDIDDTIKVTSTGDPVGILRQTFIESPKPVPGMPDLYAEMKSFLPHDTPWFYLSASPYNLYPFLRGFRDQYYPPGTMILKDMSWKTVSGLLSALTVGTEEYKVDRIRKIASWLPKRKMIAIGDSTQSDPEAYGEIYRTVPGFVGLILIRKATDISAVGLKEKNEPARFEKAFKDIPRTAWHVFEDPAECVSIVKRVVEENS